MEESLTRGIDEVFGLKERDWSQYSPLTLAYIGDDVYDLIIRTIFVKQANRQVNKLHRLTAQLVRAKTQAAIVAAILPDLTEEEAAVYRRGHNSNPHTIAKNASRREYLEATGFEALIGYLYLQRRNERLLTLTRTGLERIGMLPV
ncbi:MAG: ribonuclease III domain-containing protein [Lachnospiraceae bacterium]|nr:ribonuclease III domain-containing protein [Lachnospiraceae bacterium]